MTGRASTWAALSEAEASILIAADAIETLTCLVVGGHLNDEEGRLMEDPFSTFALGVVTELNRAESRLSDAMGAIRRSGEE